MRVMGMDLSWTGSALVTLEVEVPGHAELVSTVLLNRGSKSRFNSRALVGIENLEYVTRGIIEALSEGRPDLVALEDYGGGHGGNPFTLAQCGEVTGGAKLSMRAREIPWVEVAPATLKKFVTGKGNAKKHQVLEGCFKRFGVGSETLGADDNVIDAYCLARFAGLYNLHQKGRYSPKTYELETFGKARTGGSDRPSKRRRVG